VSLNYVDKRRYRAVDVEEIAFSFFEFDTIIFSECLHEIALKRCFVVLLRFVTE